MGIASGATKSIEHPSRGTVGRLGGLVRCGRNQSFRLEGAL